MAQEMILVPEMEFQRLKECNENDTRSSEILNEVKRPDETELVKIYRGMENALNDSSIPAQEKRQKHVQAMNNFTLLRDRINNRVTEPLVREKSEITDREKGTGNDDDESGDERHQTLSDVVDLFPPTLKRTAHQLLQRLSRRRDIIDWDEKGEVKIGGKRMSGSHIGDLVGDIIRTRKTVNPLRRTFLNALAEANIPDEFVRNKDALTEYRGIKGGSRRAIRPPGLPEKLFEKSSEKLLGVRKKRAPKVKRLDKIKWKTL